MRRFLIRRAAAAILLLTTGAAACAYFNEIYNANRLFDEAQRAAASGSAAQAQSSFELSIKKAAKGLRDDPDGRWADDALYLIARAHFQLGEMRAARAALERILAMSEDTEMRLGARAYLGAAEARLTRYDVAESHLDSVIGSGETSDRIQRLARLWRARAHFELGEPAAAWKDLEEAAGGEGRMARVARLEAAGRAVTMNEPERAERAIAGLLSDSEAERWADSIRTLVRTASDQWGAGTARSLLSMANEAPWPPNIRDDLSLYRAVLMAEAGDTAAAMAEMDALIGRASGRIGARTRVEMARLQLARAQDLKALQAIREILLPAINNAGAQRLIQSMRTLTVLIDQGRRQGRTLGLFAAAELARDELHSRGIARALFLEFANAANDSPWAGKALLAASGLDAAAGISARIRARLDAMGDNVYLAAWNGRTTAGRFQLAEEELADSLAVLFRRAEERAAREDVLVTQTIEALDDSIATALADSIAAACGFMIDSLRIEGIRADSVLAACKRQDSIRVDSLLVVDTMLWVDTTAADSGMFADTLFPDTVFDQDTVIDPDSTAAAAGKRELRAPAPNATLRRLLGLAR